MHYQYTAQTNAKIDKSTRDLYRVQHELRVMNRELENKYGFDRRFCNLPHFLRRQAS